MQKQVNLKKKAGEEPDSFDSEHNDYGCSVFIACNTRYASHLYISNIVRGKSCEVKKKAKKAGDGEWYKCTLSKNPPTSDNGMNIF